MQHHFEALFLKCLVVRLLANLQDHAASDESIVLRLHCGSECRNLTAKARHIGARLDLLCERLVNRDKSLGIIFLFSALLAILLFLSMSGRFGGGDREEAGRRENGRQGEP